MAAVQLAALAFVEAVVGVQVTAPPRSAQLAHLKSCVPLVPVPMGAMPAVNSCVPPAAIWRVQTHTAAIVQSSATAAALLVAQFTAPPRMPQSAHAKSCCVPLACCCLSAVKLWLPAATSVLSQVLHLLGTVQSLSLASSESVAWVCV